MLFVSRRMTRPNKRQMEECKDYDNGVWFISEDYELWAATITPAGFLGTLRAVAKVSGCVQQHEMSSELVCLLQVPCLNQKCYIVRRDRGYGQALLDNDPNIFENPTPDALPWMDRCSQIEFSGTTLKGTSRLLPVYFFLTSPLLPPFL